ncbi:MAG: sulfurtransferase TusA family protein [Methanopyri archaeon]|jgi:tRNA 2-thiouridine synthesizing protein A|nr:sulfurtransferase TusA family protein [Methanopyri archaeon]|tara:strand:+ start:132 stop:398 length:267 start_codon:yes stop_codon:yes gene_type:complete
MTSQGKLGLEELEKGRYALDALGYSCPYPEVLTRRALKTLSSGDVLEVVTDNVPSFDTILSAAEKLGCTVLETTDVDKTSRKIIIKKG